MGIMVTVENRSIIYWDYYYLNAIKLAFYDQTNQQKSFHIYFFIDFLIKEILITSL